LFLVDGRIVADLRSPTAAGVGATLADLRARARGCDLDVVREER
jgi:hypothetical protein